MNDQKMIFYLAPMEGVTSYIFRNTLQEFYEKDTITKYFSPFIAANQNGKMKTREKQDVLPENNRGLRLIPQILTNNAEDFLRTVNDLKEYGYDEVNLNLGCPSGTVANKCKGSGFLAERERLDHFLEEIFEHSTSKISIKTRLGKDDPDEFYKIIEMYNKYPLEELIIHPRIQKDYYKNKPNLKVFGDALRLSKHSICYNGDIFTKEDYDRFHEAFPNVTKVMLGRGIIANPGLIHNIYGEKPMDIKLMRVFHDHIYAQNKEILSGDTNVLYKMKEQWFYMIHMFEDSEKIAKKIRKCNRLTEYDQIITELFTSKEFNNNLGYVSKA